jgi:hypothetical protein
VTHAILSWHDARDLCAEIYNQRFVTINSEEQLQNPDAPARAADTHIDVFREKITSLTLDDYFYSSSRTINNKPVARIDGRASQRHGNCAARTDESEHT